MFPISSYRYGYCAENDCDDDYDDYDGDGRDDACDGGDDGHGGGDGDDDHPPHHLVYPPSCLRRSSLVSHPPQPLEDHGYFGVPKHSHQRHQQVPLQDCAQFPHCRKCCRLLGDESLEDGADLVRRWARCNNQRYFLDGYFPAQSLPQKPD